jgi:hypothetical protein
MVLLVQLIVLAQEQVVEVARAVVRLHLVQDLAEVSAAEVLVQTVSEAAAPEVAVA